MPPAFDVLGIGENSLDEVYRLPSFPQPGTATAKMQVCDRVRLPGGQVATAMTACAAWGLRTAYLGVFGDDEHGRVVRTALAQRGVDVSSAPVRAGANRHAAILVDERTGDRVVLWDREPAMKLLPEDLLLPLVAGARLVHVDDTEAAVALRASSLAREAGAIVTSDIESTDDSAVELISAVSVAIFASHVPQLLTGETDPGRALRALRQRHGAMLCVTRGEHGSMLLTGDRLYEAPAFSVTAVDTTGAGDIFRAGMIYALLRGERPDRMLRWGNAAAALACTRHGAMDSVPSLEQVHALVGS
jgi:sugar/nucleoside kinase (ribokinase family)